MRVCVYCSSSDRVAPIFMSEIQVLGESLAEAGFEVVYGGASVGPMGVLARAALSRGGKVHGVVPKQDFMLDIVQSGMTSQIEVPSLWERKQKMLEMSDVILAFPGGIGTLDEVTDILALKTTKETDKPLYFLNIFDFWTPFLEVLELMAQQNMIYSDLSHFYQSFTSTEDLLSELKKLKA